jgi:hypothetical protein
MNLKDKVMRLTKLPPDPTDTPVAGSYEHGNEIHYYITFPNFYILCPSLKKFHEIHALYTTINLIKQI